MSDESEDDTDKEMGSESEHGEDKEDSRLEDIDRKHPPSDE